MHILLTLIIGLFVGAVAKLIIPGRDPGGTIIAMLLGTAGAALAGFIGRGLGLHEAANAGPGVLASIIGAVVLLAAFLLVSHRRMAPR